MGDSRYPAAMLPTPSPSRSLFAGGISVILGAGCLLAACSGRAEPDAGRSLSAGAQVRLSPRVVFADGAPHLTVRGAFQGTPERFAAVDPCVVRVHGEQFTATLVEREGELRVPLGIVPTHDAVVGLSTVARALGDGFVSEHHKAIVAAGGDKEAPVPTTAVTARIGLRAELTPLLDPCVLGAGDALPVRLSLDLAAADGVTLCVAYSPSADAEPDCVEVRTRAGGFADVAIRGPGEHVVSAQATVGRLDGAPEHVSVSLAFVAGGRR